jgi:6-phosphogluconolactonase
MRFLLIMLAMVASARAAFAADCTGSTCGPETLWIGTQGSGPGQGIFTATLDPRTGALAGLRLAAQTERSTWIVRDPKRPILYTVREVGNDGSTQGGVLSFAIGPGGTLRPLGEVSSGGGGPTYLSLDRRGKALFVANFGGGQVSVVPVAVDGKLAAPVSVRTDTGSGPHRRQKGPHAHGVVVDPSGRFVLVPDFGADRVFVYRLDAATGELAPAGTPTFAVPPGSGPRHLVFAADGKAAFLLTELTAQVYVLGWDARIGELSKRSTIALDPTDAPGTRSSGEIGLSRDGRTLYVSNRRNDTIQVFSVGAHDKALREIQSIASGGHLPWSFALDPKQQWLVVAHQGSETVTVLRRDVRSGELDPAGPAFAVPKAVHIAFDGA